MSTLRSESIDGVVRKEWASDGTFREYDEEGVIIDARTRPFEGDELVMLAVTPISPAFANHRTLTTQVAAQVPSLLTSIETLKVMLAIPKADLTNTELRQTMKEVRAMARATVQVARLVGNVLDVTDSGTA